MGLLPGGEKLGLLPTSGISNGEKKPPLLSHKLTGAEITAVRQLITGYRCHQKIFHFCQKWFIATFFGVKCSKTDT